MFSGLEPIEELHARACNKGTKTESVAAFVLACLQKRVSLDGIPIPQWRGRVEAAQLVLDYPQQLLSVQPAYLRLLGNWPHHSRFKGETLSSLEVMPLGGNDDRSKWSVVHFLSQENRRSGTGVRGDIIAFDEPPRIGILRELRKAAHAHRQLCILIGETPTILPQWAPIRADYEASMYDALKECPRSAIRRLDPERAEVRWSLSEVADWLLPPAEKAKLRRKYALEPFLADAREHGDYCVTDADCPWGDAGTAALLQMLEECEDAQEREWTITREVDGEDGRVKAQTRVIVHVLQDPVHGERYYLNIDPSRGFESTRHDPGGILVRKESNGEDVALYEGFVGSYGLGSLAAGLARQYNEAIVDPESNAGWIEGVMHGLGDAGYGNIAKTQRVGRDGAWETRWGFETTELTRPAMIGELQAWMAAFAAGTPYARCRFRRVIDTLLTTKMDEKGKIVAAPGFHDEFMILKGQSLRKFRPARPTDYNLARPAVLPPKREPDDLTLEKLIAGAREEHGGRRGFARMKERPRG